MKIKPAPLVDNLQEMERQLKNAELYTAEADIDIVNWQRTPKKTVMASEVLSLKFNLSINLDLMEDDPTTSIELGLKDPRVKMIIINTECKLPLEDVVKKIEAEDKLIGVSLNPEDSIDFFINNDLLLEHVSLVQIMTVEPGVQGNPFLASRLEVANDLRKAGFKGMIQVDGGVNTQTIPIILGYPIDAASVGSALSKAEDPVKVFAELTALANPKPAISS